MKDYEAFEKQTGVCYIPETSDREYTYEDLLEISGNNVILTNRLFDLLEWQHPETLIDEWISEEEIDENFNILNP